VVLAHVGVVLGLLELLQRFDDVGKHFDLLLFGEFGVEVVGLEGLFQERQHDQIGDEEVVVTFPGLRLQEKVLVESFIVDDSFHSLEMAEIELGSQVLGVAAHATHPRLLALRLVAR
jgi:hypothetical protein